MNREKPDTVSASEIASWAYCPESWRLSSLGHEPENRAAIAKGERHRADKAVFEQVSGAAVSAGWWLVAAAALLALALVVF